MQINITVPPSDILHPHQMTFPQNLPSSLLHLPNLSAFMFRAISQILPPTLRYHSHTNIVVCAGLRHISIDKTLLRTITRLMVSLIYEMERQRYILQN